MRASLSSDLSVRSLIGRGLMWGAPFPLAAGGSHSHRPAAAHLPDPAASTPRRPATAEETGESPRAIAISLSLSLSHTHTGDALEHVSLNSHGDSACGWYVSWREGDEKTVSPTRFTGQGIGEEEV